MKTKALPHPEVDPSAIRFFHSSLAEWYQREKRDLPWRREPTPYHVAVSELMCQQTQIVTVLPYYKRWMEKFPDWRTLAQAREEDVLKEWEGLGYYRRARMLHALARAVVELPSGELPDSVEELKRLPGIGPYTAGAIASIAFGSKASLVDGNVERVLSRVFNFSGDLSISSNRKFLLSVAEKLLPEKNCGDHNQALMELGARICTPRKPSCIICPLQKICRAENPESLPVKKREASISEKETLAILVREGKVWLSLPEKPRRWKGFYRLPDFDASRMEKGELLGIHAYSITKYRIKAEVFSVSCGVNLSRGKWFSKKELEKTFLPAPHRKMIEFAAKSHK